MRLARLRPTLCRAPARSVDVWRVLGAFASVVLVFSQAFVALHLVLIPHRLCALHGLEDTPVLGARPTPEVAPATRAHRPAATRDVSSEGAHERCVLLSTLHDRLAVVTATGAHRLAAPASMRTPSVGSDHPFNHRLALWLVAPKQGPPA